MRDGNLLLGPRHAARSRREVGDMPNRHLDCHLAGRDRDSFQLGVDLSEAAETGVERVAHRTHVVDDEHSPGIARARRDPQVRSVVRGANER